jgi:threonine dehydratase
VTITIEAIRGAATTIAGAVVRTPLVRSGPLSDWLDADVHLKLETLQYTGSFKDRGALVKLRGLSPQAAKRGVIAVSAGNHAQGVAYHAQRLGIPATIVMPKPTPFTKINRTEALGARVVLHGGFVGECTPFAEDLVAKENLTFVHPYDDPDIIAGQGTVGLEILEDMPDIDTIIAPIGGGGLIAGIATAAQALRPETEIVGVEAALFPSMQQALAGRDAEAGGETIAEGIAVKSPGALTLPIVRERVSEVLTADEPALEDAVREMLVRARVLAEGAGAAPLAALIANRERFAGRRVCLVVSGANIDSRLLASVLMRGLVRDGRMVRLRVTISDAPGTLAQVTRQIGDAGGNIVEIVHQRLFYDVPVKQAEADIVVETRNPAHVEEIVGRLNQAGFPTRPLGYSAHSG